MQQILLKRYDEEIIEVLICKYEVHSEKKDEGLSSFLQWSN